MPVTIATYLMQRKNARWLRSYHLRKPLVVPSAEAKDIGLVFSEEEGGQVALNAFVERLVSEGKRVRALTYFERPRSHPFTFKLDFFEQKDIVWTGDIRNEKVDQFADFPFDYLFCVSRQGFLPFDSIILRSRAKFKIGFHVAGNEKILDFMVEPQPGDSLQTALSQLYAYTQKLSLSLHD